MNLKDAEGWQSFVDNNKDEYGKACVDFARIWAELMEFKIDKGEKLEDIADSTCSQVDNMDGFGITGFMYGCVISMLSSCWIYGEQLRRWHNLKIQIGNEGERANASGGVLNPALLSIDTKH